MKNIRFLFPGLLMSIFVLAIWNGADHGRLPDFISALYHFPYGDKVGHFLLIGILTFFVSLPFSFSLWSTTKKRIITILIIISIIITLEEISQNFFPSRSLDVMDLLFSYGGIFSFGGFVLFLSKKGALRREFKN